MSSQLGIWSYGAQVSQPIFTGGGLTGDLRLAGSPRGQALLSYRRPSSRPLAMSPMPSSAAKNFIRSACARGNRGGLTGVRTPTIDAVAVERPIFEVLDGQRSLYAAELTLARARGNEYQSRGDSTGHSAADGAISNFFRLRLSPW